MRIAIVGAGVAGLTAAHLLADKHELTVFEATPQAGGHAHTVAVDDGPRTQLLDCGFLVFNDRNYPNFERLLDSIGVAWQPSNMSFSVADGFGFEYSSASLDGLFADRRNLASAPFWRMLAEIPRFQRSARRLLEQGTESESLRHWLERERFSRFFVDRLLVPQVAAVWSADPEQLWQLPARFVFQFFANHGMLSLRNRPRWRTIRGGSQSYVKALSAPFAQRLHTSTPVESIARLGEEVQIRVRGQAPQQFDAVLLATHSDQALALLEDPSESEQAILGAISYQNNETVLHTDQTLLPRRRAAWASWNYRLTPGPNRFATVTYHLNRLQSLTSEQQYCVTLNQTEMIDPAKVIESLDWAHPVFTEAALTAQARHGEISGVRRTFYCGAYWGWGFHEDGVVSAIRAARQLGVSW